MVESLIVLIVGIKVITNLTIFLDYTSGRIIHMLVRYIDLLDLILSFIFETNNV